MKSFVSCFNAPQYLADMLARNLDLDADQAEIAHYGLQLVWTSLLSLLAAGFLAVLTGTLLQVMVGVLALAAVRLFAGGAHSNSPWRCALVGALTLSAVGRLAIYLATYAWASLPYFILGSTIVVVIAVSLLAPVDSPAKPITDPKHRRNLRTGALAAVILIGLLEWLLALRHERSAASLSFVIGLCLLWQAFSLTRAGHRVLNKLDEVLNLIRKEGVRC